MELSLTITPIPAKKQLTELFVPLPKSNSFDRAGSSDYRA